MTMARGGVVPEDGAGVFHCISRCVRRAWLCGMDPYSGRDFSHRKQWVRDRLEELAGIFAAEVYAYAVMSNHLHVVLRMRPDLANAWSDREVVERWRSLFPWQRDAQGHGVPPTEMQLATWLADPPRVALWRQRLGNLSWLMRCLNEPLARRANREDECKGRFWEGRFKCQRLCDAGAVLACMAYVDLNPVRAGLAQAPEESEFTSVKERFDAEAARRGGTSQEAVPEPAKAQCRQGRGRKPCSPLESAAWLTPMEEVRLDDHVNPSRVSLEQYLGLLDATGRLLAEGKRGVIPQHLAPVVERLELSAENWVSTVAGYGGMFQRWAGSKRRLMAHAKEQGRRWFCRGKAAITVYRGPQQATG